jgi:hypothetical protein
MFSKFMLLILVSSNLVIMGMTILACNYVTNRQVYDMDIIRSQYEVTLKRYYMRACLDGTDYPPEWRTTPTDFNLRSPPMYCTDNLSNLESAIRDEVYYLGRVRHDGD